MPGHGFGFGLGREGGARWHRPVSGGTPTPTPTPGYTAGFTLAQFPAQDTKRIHQRATKRGGGTGKGQGTIRVPLGGTVTAGTVGARIRSDDGATILQGEWEAGTITGGADHIDVSGIDARLGWFYIDLKGVDGDWQLGTVKVGMGALYGFAGQSLTARMLGRQDGATETYASLGITPNANSAVLATYAEMNTYMPTLATMPWQTPGDVGDGNGPNAIGVGRFLDKMVGLTGVNCGVIGHAEGGVPIGSFYDGQTNWTQLAALIARAGGAFEGFVWGQAMAIPSMAARPEPMPARLPRSSASSARSTAWAASASSSGPSRRSAAAAGARPGNVTRCARAPWTGARPMAAPMST